VEPHEELSDEVDGHDDRQDGLALLLLLVLQLDGHQAVVELGNLGVNVLIIILGDSALFSAKNDDL
jgi:hypothetical protein